MTNEEFTAIAAAKLDAAGATEVVFEDVFTATPKITFKLDGNAFALLSEIPLPPGAPAPVKSTEPPERIRMGVLGMMDLMIYRARRGL
jgi:hypothetical protein